MRHRAVRASADFALSDVVEQSHFAFEAMGNSYIGGDATYRARVHGHAIEIAPDDPKRDPRGTAPGHALTLQNVSLRRGSEPAKSTDEYTRDADGALTARIDDTTRERVANTAAGVEQSWTFDAKPDGRGDLVVAIGVDGQEFAAATGSGLHFKDADSGLGAMYGEARWVDANGQATKLALEYTNHEIRILVPEAVLDRTAYPAVLDPTVGPEYSVDAPILGPAANIQRSPAIGHPGTLSAEYTVVWQDQRRALGMTSDIYMATVDRNGHVLTPVGALVTPLTDNADHLSPDIYDNIVVYTSNDASGLYGVFAKNLSTGVTREIVQPPTNTLSDCSIPRITGIYQINIGWIYNVVWRQVPRTTGIGSIYTETIYSNLASFTPHQLSPAAADANYPAVAGQATSNGARFAAVWTDKSNGYYNIYGRIVNQDGTTYTNPLQISDESSAKPFIASSPSIATFGGTAAPYDGYVVAWDVNFATNRYMPDNADIYAAYFGGSGARSAPMAITNAFYIQHAPRVAGFGRHLGTSDTEALIAWVDDADGSSVHGTRVSLQGSSTLVPYDTQTFKFTGNADNDTALAVHSDDLGGYFLAWGDWRNTNYLDIYGGNIPFSAPAFTASPPVAQNSYLISSSANTETSPSIARCGSTYLAVWTDSRQRGADDFDIYGVRLDSSGTPIGSSFSISNAAGAQDSAVVTCTSSTAGTFFVAWVDQRNGNADIYGTQVTSTGGVTSPSGVPLATSTMSETYPALASDNAGHVWLTYNQGSESLWGTRLDATGNTTIPPAQLTPSGINADIDFDAASGNFLIAYQVIQATKEYDIWAAPMTVGGTVGTRFAVEQSIGNQRFAQVRFDQLGGTATVVYEDDRNLSVTHTDIYSRRVNTIQVLTNPVAVAASNGNEQRPRLVTRSGSLQEVTFFTTDTNVPPEYDVNAVSLNAGNVVGAPFAVSARAGVREMTPGIACSATTCVVPYRSYDPTDQLGADRIKARALSY